MRPRGPLPRRIYWTRRALAVAVALSVLGVLWWLVPGGSNPGDRTAGVHTGSTTSTTPTSTGPISTPPSSTTKPPVTTPRSSPPKTSPPSGGSTTTHRPPRAEPTGPCAPTVVRILVAADSAPPGYGTTVRYTMSTNDGSTCRLGITPALLETKIVSFEQVAWRSSSCPDALAAKNVVVRPQPAVLYSFHWDGVIRLGACTGTGTTAPPARYRVSAALIGGEPHGSDFFITEPDGAGA